MTTASEESNAQGPLMAALSRQAGQSRSHQGSLRSKLVLSLAGIFLIFLLIDDQVRQKVIKTEFNALEHTGAIRDANRVLAALNSEVEHLCDLARYWESADGLLTNWHGRPTVESGDPPWHRQRVDFVVRLHRGGEFRWLYGEPTDSRVKIAAADQLRSLADACAASQRERISGMTRIGVHPLSMFAVIDLSPQDASTEQHEYLVVARNVDQATVASLSRQTQVEFALQSPRTIDPVKKLVVWEADPLTLVVEVQLLGVHGDHLANVYLEVPREITVHTNRTTALTRNTFIFFAVAALLLLLLLLQRLVIAPLAAIREYSGKVVEQGLATEPLMLCRNDEIGELAAAYDSMFSHLSKTQTQLTEASQAAGRSQVASTVIHNVGNVLTNVNSLLDAACGRVQGLRIDPLEKLASRLRQDDSDDGLLAATPDYLEGLAGSLKSDQQLLGGLLKTLNENVRHIHDVLRAQRHHTDRRINASAEHLRSVIGEAIACCRARLEQDSVSVNVSVPAHIHVYTDRSLLLQTVINIIGNARLSMQQDEGERRLDITVQQNEQNIRVVFGDTGCGMDQETLRRAFEAHFTTRQSGTGLGLHFCAITLKRLGGSIHATSEGLGRGSTFTIELPVRKTGCGQQSREHAIAVSDGEEHE